MCILSIGARFNWIICVHSFPRSPMTHCGMEWRMNSSKGRSHVSMVRNLGNMCVFKVLTWAEGFLDVNTWYVVTWFTNCLCVLIASVTLLIVCVSLNKFRKEPTVQKLSGLVESGVLNSRAACRSCGSCMMLRRQRSLGTIVKLLRSTISWCGTSRRLKS